MTTPDVGQTVAFISHIRADRYDALDGSAGVAGCHARLTQLEQDPRWTTRYFVGAHGSDVWAVVPTYICRTESWPDPAYDPATWGLPPARTGPAHCVLVGGRSDLRSSLHVAEPHRGTETEAALVARVANMAAAQGRRLVFPYVYADTVAAVSRLPGLRTQSVVLGQEASFHDPLGESTTSRVRGVLRRDRREIAAYGITSTVCGWPEVEADAADLVATHNIRKGTPDHPEFVRMRMRRWASCAGVEPVVFTGSMPETDPASPSGGYRAFLTGLVWHRSLELYEVGLPAVAHPARRALYVELLVHAPLRFAARRGLRVVRAGLAAEATKSSRGATLTPVYGVVADPIPDQLAWR